MILSPNDYAVHNGMEDVVDQAIQQVLSEDSAACNCSLCRDDMKSMILNAVPPLYHPILSEGEMPRKITLEKLETPIFNKVMIECYMALVKVKGSPRHGQKRSPLFNSTETILVGVIQDVLKQENLTLEKDNLSRLLANALNSLKPRYTTTLKGDVFSRTVELDPSYLAKLYASVYNSLKEIRNQSQQASIR